MCLSRESSTTNTNIYKPLATTGLTVFFLFLFSPVCFVLFICFLDLSDMWTECAWTWQVGVGHIPEPQMCETPPWWETILLLSSLFWGKKATFCLHLWTPNQEPALSEDHFAWLLRCSLLRCVCVWYYCVASMLHILCVSVYCRWQTKRQPSKKNHPTSPDTCFVTDENVIQMSFIILP